MHPLQLRILELAKTQDVAKLSLREVGDYIGERHPQKIKHHLHQLEKKKLLNLVTNNSLLRNVVEGKNRNNNFIEVPILGEANCGEAIIFADNHIEGYLVLSTQILTKRKNIYALKAVGNSMDCADIGGKSIENGDYVIIDGNNTEVKNGDYVVSIINGRANIKRYYFDGTNGQIVLVAESAENYTPIFIHPNEFNGYLVSGKVLQIIKKPQLI